MGEKPLRAVLIGAGGFGAHTLEALGRSKLLEVAAVADRDASTASKAAAQAQCPAYTDNRRALVEPRPDVAFLALPPVAAAEAVRLAAERGVHVWTGPPLARNLPQAVEMCRQTRAAGIKLAVGTQRRFCSNYRRASELASKLEEIYLLEAQYLFNWGGPLGWRGSVAAGGGAMCQLGCHMLELVIHMLGLPETIYCITGTGQRSRGHNDQGLYDTDDTATAILHYTGQATATVTVSRRFSPVSDRLTIFGQAGSIVVSPSRCVLRDRDGAVEESFEQQEPPAAALGRGIEAFARAVIENSDTYECSGWEALLTMAAVEAAYLSARTVQPESPAALLAGYDVTVADCLELTPAEVESDEAQRD